MTVLFVLAVPVQTSVGKIHSVVVVWESGSASALPSRRRLFHTISCGNPICYRPVVLSTRQHSPRNPRELVGHRNYNDVLGRSGIECIKPGSDRCSVAFNAQHGGSCTVNQDLPQVNVAALADAEQLRLPSG